MIYFFLSLFLSSASANSSDPLFSQMVGHWSGEGTRHYSLSEQVSQISEDVQSEIQLIDGKDRLISKNQVTESFSSADPKRESKSYQLSYWIEAQVGTAGKYQLGSKISIPASAQPVSEGSLSMNSSNQLVFETSQSFGDYIIHSQTQFTDSGSTYTETMTIGAKLLSTTVIQYVLGHN